MICAVMQPTYLPWSGYFNIIATADIFVLLDDAQFQKNSWHNRNRLLVNHSPHWITVPVRHKTLSQSIRETEIDSTQKWWLKHSKLLRNVYSRHPFADDILDICTPIEQNDADNLAELNIKLIYWMLNKLKIQTKVILSSTMSIEGRRTTRLVDLLQYLKADCYLSPKGALNYLEEDGFSDLTSIELVYQEFTPSPYTQYRHQPFESHLSIVDVVANIGVESTRNYIV